MKKFLLVLILFILSFTLSKQVVGQCTNTSAYGSATAPSTNTPIEVSTCNYEDEYNTISGVVAGETYESASDCGSYITVRSGTSGGAVVAHGWSPLSWTAAVSGTHYIHYNTSAACGTDASCCTTTLTCTSCTPPSGDNIDDVDGTTIIDCSATIYDSGGFSGSYTNSEDYSVTICSGTADLMEISFASFATESGWDYVYVYDGNSTGAPQVTGSPFSGTTNPGTITASGTCITIRFTSDGSTTSTGFEINANCVPPPCNPANVTVTQTCAPDNSNYDLEVDVTALVDASSVDIIIGGTTEESSVGVGTYTYNGLTSGTTVLVVDDSDPTCTYSETIIMCSNEHNIDAVDGTTLTGCNYTIYDSGGSTGDYANNELYTVTICSGTADYIGVSFADFYTESIDDLNIYDGVGTGGTLIASLSGSTIPSDITTTSTCITIEFDSDGSIVYDGFELITSCICNPANTTITQTCAGDNSYYDLSIVISAMVEAATVNIVVGGTTEYSGVGVGTYSVNGLVAGTTVQIIDAADPTCIYSETISMCDLCNSPSAPSDECSAAPLIDLSQPFEGSTDCSYTVGAENPAESCGVSLDNDSWMTFIAGSTDVEIDYTVGDCEPISDGIQLNVFSGTCATLTEVPGSCVNPTGENTTGTWNFTGLTIGEIYYIRIDGYAGDLCDYYFEPVTGVVITPPNDECPDAELLTCGDTDVASNILATADDAPSGCAGGGTPAEGVWYSFIGDGSEVTISTDNPGTNFDTEINIFEGPCTALTCVGGDNDGGVGMTSSFTFTTTNGTEYFIYVDGDGAAIGQFEVSLTCNTAVPCDADAGAWD
ncbi:MAG: hypothetical protein JXR36_14515 [Bacteroidales bacterium]|nr:hypothetical protein [Bacteroidales bacterium]